MFSSLLKMYNAWNDNDMDKEEEEEKDFIKILEKSCGFTAEDEERVVKELEAAKADYSAMDKEDQKLDAELSALQEQLQLLNADERKQIGHMKAQKKYLKDLSVERKQLDADELVLDSDIQRLKQEHIELNATIRGQPMSMEEHNKILDKCTQIERSMKIYEDHLEELNKKIWEKEIKLSNARDQFQKAVLSFNQEISINMSLGSRAELDELMMPEILPLTGIMGILKKKSRAMGELKDNVKKQLNSHKSKLNAKITELENLQEQAKALSDAKAEMDLKTKETMDSIKQMKKNSKKKETKLLDGIHKLQEEIKFLKESMPDNAAVDEELREAQEKLQAVLRRKKHGEDSAARIFKKVFKMMADHKNEMMAAISSVEGKFKEANKGFKDL